jgi:hypothetical protein
MIELKVIEERLMQRQREVALLRRSHEMLLKRVQNELQASQSAFEQAAGAMAELEELKKLAGQGSVNGEQSSTVERSTKRIKHV